MEKVPHSCLFHAVKLVLSNPDSAYISNPGNMGDALIAAGFFRNVEFFSGRFVQARDYDGGQKSVIYAGGGNLVGFYSNCANVIEKFLDSGGCQFILLPHTVRNCDELLKRLDGRFTFYLRDLESYYYVCDMNPNIQCHLCDDLALGIDRIYAEKLINSLPLNFSRALVLRNSGAKRIVHAAWNFRKAPVRKGRVAVKRTDREGDASYWKSLEGIPYTVDISALYYSNYVSKLEIELAAGAFLSFIDNFTQIYTDRLHVGIAAAILNKEVTLIDTSQRKVSGVYNLSLRENQLGSRPVKLLA